MRTSKDTVFLESDERGIKNILRITGILNRQEAWNGVKDLHRMEGTLSIKDTRGIIETDLSLKP